MDQSVICKDYYYICPDYEQEQIKVLGSKFIAHLFHVETVEAAEKKLTEIRKKYYDANHNCYAFRINDRLIRYSDDGEPNQTAGKPIYDVILGNDLYETLVIVTRYFGGTKLGTGGLLRAYSDSTAAVLGKIKKIKKTNYREVEISYSYDDTSIVMHLVQRYSAKIKSQNYEDKVTLTALISISKAEKFLKDLSEMSNGRILNSSD